MRRGMLGTEIDRVILDFRVAIGRIGGVGMVVQLFQIISHDPPP